MSVGMTELNAINICLRAVGESPVITADSSNPYVFAARDIISDKSRDLQSKGWYFNTVKGFKFKRDVKGQLFVPQDLLSINTHAGVSVAIRGNRLFDLKKASFIFDGDLEADIVTFVKFEELPYVAAKLVAYMSAEEMQSSYESDRVKVVRLYEQIKDAEIELKKVHLRNINANVMDRSVFVSAGVRRRRNPNFIGG